MDSAAIAAGVADFTTPGAEFPFARAAPLAVTHGLSGAALPLASLWEPSAAAASSSPTTTLLVFGRNLLWWCIRDWLSDARDGLDLAKLAAAGVRVRVVLPVPLWAMQRFLREEMPGHALAEALYCDPGGAAFRALGQFNLKFDTRSTFTSPHAQTTVAQATWKGLVLGLRFGTQGDPRQQGGVFVVRAAGAGDGDNGKAAPVTLWAHIDRHNADQVPIPVLCRAAGLPDDMYRHPRLSAAQRRELAEKLAEEKEAAAAPAAAPAAGKA